MKLKRYIDFINEAKKGLQMSLFPDIVPHEQPEPEAPTGPNTDAIDKDLLMEYLIEMTDAGWNIEFYDHIVKNSPLDGNVEGNDAEVTDVLLPGENRICLVTTFTNLEDSEAPIADTLYALEGVVDEAGYVTYYCKEDNLDTLTKREDFEDFEGSLMANEVFHAVSISKKPFIAKARDIAEYYDWKVKEQSGGPSYVIKDDELWVRMDQIDLAHVMLSSEKEIDNLIDGFDYSNHDYDPDYFLDSVLADLDKQAQKVLFDKMVDILGLERLQDLIDDRTDLKTKGKSEEQTMKDLFWREDAVFRVTNANHLLEVKLILKDLCSIYTDMVADSAEEQDNDTMQYEFDDLIKKYFTFEKSDEKVTFSSGKDEWTTYIYHIKLTKDMLVWLEDNGYGKSDFESSPEDVISYYFQRRYDTWTLDIRKSEGWVSTSKFSRVAEKIINSN